MQGFSFKIGEEEFLFLHYLGEEGGKDEIALGLFSKKELLALSVNGQEAVKTECKAKVDYEHSYIQKSCFAAPYSKGYELDLLISFKGGESFSARLSKVPKSLRFVPKY